MSKGFRVAVVGATGLVGDTMLSVLDKRGVASGRMEAMKERMRSSCGEAHL